MTSWRNNLASFMKEMATKANFAGHTLTNYSAGKHLVQKIHNLNVPPTHIMQISRQKIVQFNYSQKLKKFYSWYFLS